MAYQNLFAIISPSSEGDGKEHMETCPDCHSPFIDYAPDRLYKHVQPLIKPDWYMVKFSRDGTIGIQPMFRESVNAKA